jgi:large repetitive protein
VTFTATISGSPSVGTVTFYAGPGLTNQIGAPVSVSGGTATSDSDSSLGAGSYTISAVYSGGTNFAGSQGTLSVTVNGPAPSVSSVTINGGAYIDPNTGNSENLAGQNSVVQNFLVNFNESVTLDSGAVTITPHAGVIVNSGEQPSQLAVTAVVTAVANSNGTQYLITFSGPGVGANGVIDDGVYDLTIIASKVHANSQTLAVNQVTTFWKLYGSLPANNTVTPAAIGDGNSEVFVNNNDYTAFKSTYNSESDLSSPQYNAFLDSNLDGFIGNGDFNAFKKSYNSDWSF